MNLKAIHCQIYFEFKVLTIDDKEALYLFVYSGPNGSLPTGNMQRLIHFAPVKKETYSKCVNECF